MKISRTAWLWFASAVSLSLPTYLSIAAPWPRLWSPCSFILWALSWREPSGVWPYTVAPLAFLILTIFIFVSRRAAKGSWIVLVSLAALLSLAWHLLSFEYGLRYQGAFHTIGLLLINAGILSLAVTWLFRGRHDPDGRQPFVAAWLFAAWLVTYAFPYLGEFP